MSPFSVQAYTFFPLTGSGVHPLPAPISFSGNPGIDENTLPSLRQTVCMWPFSFIANAPRPAGSHLISSFHYLIFVPGQKYFHHPMIVSSTYPCCRVTSFETLHKYCCLLIIRKVCNTGTLLCRVRCKSSCSLPRIFRHLPTLLQIFYFAHYP